MPFWDNQVARAVFGQDPDSSVIQLDGKETTAWPLDSVAPPAQQPHSQPKTASSLLVGDGSLLDFYDLTKSLDDFAFDTPESPPSSSDEDSSSERESSPSLSDLSPNRSFTLLTLDSDDAITIASPTARPWEQYLPKTTPPHLRAYRFSSRRPKSSRPQLQPRPEPPKLMIKHQPQLLNPVETDSDLNIDYSGTSFLLPSPLSPCMPANFPRPPQNSPDSAYFPSPSASPILSISSSTTAPISIPLAKSQVMHQRVERQEPEIVTTTCRKTPYYPPNSSQTEDRSRIYMNRGPHYIPNWTPLSSLPIDAQRKIERNMVRFTAPEGKMDPQSRS